jgi:hypothetical protein
VAVPSALQKPRTPRDLARKLRKVLDAAASTGHLYDLLG